MMFAGLTVANVVGVPADTVLSQYVGWRATFGVCRDRRSERGGDRALVAQPAPGAGGLSRESPAFGASRCGLRWRWERSASAGVFAAVQLHRP